MNDACTGRSGNCCVSVVAVWKIFDGSVLGWTSLVAKESFRFWKQILEEQIWAGFLIAKLEISVSDFPLKKMVHLGTTDHKIWLQIHHKVHLCMDAPYLV